MKELKPKVCVLKTDGINCDQELAFAFQQAGGDPRFVHVNSLLSGDENLKEYQILAIPGGFSYGDDVASGRILANELIYPLGDKTNDHINNKGLVIGICNGFQVLARSGILPFNEPIQTLADMKATLANNDSGHFECRWINLRTEPDNSCVFMQDMLPNITYQVAHGEGKFFARQAELDRIEAEKLVVFRYADSAGNPTDEYPANPNGSLNAVAGITDPSGRILGLMPHPERYVLPTQHPNWQRLNNSVPQGLPVFENMIQYARGM